MIKEDNINSKLDLTSKQKEILQNKAYGVYNHSAVQICTWNKKAMTGKGVCYKEKFYGVDCHRCMQLSPVSMWCQQNCTFCWRPMEYMKNIKINANQVDEPKDIIVNLTRERQLLLNGFKGNDKVDLKFWEDAIKPNHYAISLSGEPTLYPKLNEMIKYLKSLEDTKTIFIVSNGQETDYFRSLIDNEEHQPTQLYISIDAPTKELFQKINCSLYKDGWERLNETLKYFSQIKCRRVFRMTQIKGLNDLNEHLELYNDVIELGKPDIIEVKAYMHIGLSQNRHTKEQMPEFDEVQEFANKIIEVNKNYEVAGDMIESRIVILRRKDSRYKAVIENFEN